MWKNFFQCLTRKIKGAKKHKEKLRFLHKINMCLCAREGLWEAWKWEKITVHEKDCEMRGHKNELLFKILRGDEKAWDWKIRRSGNRVKNGMKGNNVEWDEMRWGETKWSGMKWSKVKWSEMKNYCEWLKKMRWVRWGEKDWNEVGWSEVKWNEKNICVVG